MPDSNAINAQIAHIFCTVANARIQLYDAPQDGQPELLQDITFAAQDTFQAEIAHFLDCLEQQREPLTDAREARRTLAAVLAGYESMQRGARVYLTGMDV